ncbi:MAG: DUF2807 domain-containing protein [Sphingomonadales bacterium]|nr:MAG: DUF2807 domain-containing protein [Sphingomonadales bacterium]
MRLLMIALALPAMTACQSKWEKDGGTAAAPSGQGASRTYAASGFTGVDLRGSDDVDVKTGANFSVTAEGDPKVLDQLEITVVNGTLRVGRKDGKWTDGDDSGVTVRVVMPKLQAASVTGSGDLTVDRAEGDVSAAVAGSGNLSIADLRGGAANLSIAGSGDLSVKGVATKLSASIAGSGDIEADGLTASSADVAVAGSGNVTSIVKGAASVSILGSGDVELTGGAKCTVSALGSGEAHCS